MCQGGGGIGEEGNKEDETPDIGGSQESAKDVDSLLFKHEYGESGTEDTFSDNTCFYIKEMHSLRDEGESE